MKTLLNKSSFILSLLIHIGLIASFLFAFNNKPKQLVTEKILASYTVRMKQQSAKKNTATKQISSHFKKITPASLHAINHEEHIDKEKNLLSILHQLIAEQQIYPDTALALQQQGTVKVGFYLYPDGHLTQIALQKSSGYSTLDNAALSAVNQLSSVNIAKEYLTQPTFFSVDIIFA